MPLIGKKDHRDLGANLFLRGSKYFKPNASGIAAGDGKGRAYGLICHHQSTCTKNSNFKAPGAKSSGFETLLNHHRSWALMIDYICAGAQLGEKAVGQA